MIFDNSSADSKPPLIGVPATNFTQQYYAMCVYVEGIDPIVHTYETEEERDEVFVDFRDALDEYRENCSKDNK